MPNNYQPNTNQNPNFGDNDMGKHLVSDVDNPLEEEHDIFNFEKSGVRKNFIKKVYLILFFQLGITCGFTIFAMNT